MFESIFFQVHFVSVLTGFTAVGIKTILILLHHVNCIHWNNISLIEILLVGIESIIIATDDCVHVYRNSIFSNRNSNNWFKSNINIIGTCNCIFVYGNCNAEQAWLKLWKNRAQTPLFLNKIFCLICVRNSDFK